MTCKLHEDQFKRDHCDQCKNPCKSYLQDERAHFVRELQDHVGRKLIKLNPFQERLAK